MSTKPKVEYIDCSANIVKGRPARVMPLNHPEGRLNNRWCWTTPVLKIGIAPNGLVFETENTIYSPAATEEPVGFTFFGALLNAIRGKRLDGGPKLATA